MNPSDEEWRPIPEWEGIYQVSNQGRVRSLDRIVLVGNTHRKLPSRPRKFTVLPKGYRQIQLHIDGTVKALLVHRLVLTVFHGPPPPGLEACHINGDTSDNRIENLMWDTHAANISDAVRAGKHVGSAVRCPQGHDLDAGNTYLSAAGSRSCKKCRRRVSRESYERRKGSPSPPPRKCAGCDTPIPWPVRGRPRKWCSANCQQRTERAALMLVGPA